MTTVTLKNEHAMNEANSEKLFLVCPFCQMEPPIRRQFGDAYFLTAPGAIFRFSEPYLDCIKQIIVRERISELHVAVSPECNFIHNVLQELPDSGLPCETVIRRFRKPGDTAETLAQKIIDDQIRQLHAEHHFGKELAAGQLSVHSHILPNTGNTFFKTKKTS